MPSIRAGGVIGLRLIALAAALLIDRALGDPPWMWKRVPHPVVLFGRLIGWLDGRYNDGGLTFRERRRRGILAVLFLVTVAAALGTAFALLFGSVPLGIAAEALLVAILLAHRSLYDHVAAVERNLRSEGIEAARRSVAHIVGRNVAELDKAGVGRAAIESAAENFSDGLVAPAFWYAVLGLPGLLVFKILNTADSMIGHRSPRHEAFGWAAARMDDAANFIPARLSALLVALSGALAGCGFRNAADAALRDAPLHKSPNAGWPEAALAGALGLALGGPRSYGGIAVDGVWLNPEGQPAAGPDDIRAALRLIDAAWALLLVLVGGAAIIFLALAR